MKLSDLNKILILIFIFNFSFNLHGEEEVDIWKIIVQIRKKN